jgi:hypothetical protein
MQTQPNFSLDVWSAGDGQFLRAIVSSPACDLSHCVKDQIQRMARRGGDLAGYIRYYTRTSRYAIDAIVRLYEEDLDELAALRAEVKKEQEELGIADNENELTIGPGGLYEDVEIW